MAHEKIDRNGTRTTIDTASKKAIVETYTLLKQRNNPDGWSPDFQVRNFRYASRFIMDAGASADATVLDVGCGTGKFFDTWRTMHLGTYTGIDMSPSPNDRLKTDVITAGGKFIVGEFTSATLDQVDFIVASGVVSVGTPSNKYDFFTLYVQKMLTLARKGIYLNYWEEGMNDGSIPAFLDYDSSQIDVILSRMISASQLTHFGRATDHVTYDGKQYSQQHIFIQ